MENGGTDVSLDLYTFHGPTFVGSSVLTATVEVSSFVFAFIRENGGVIAHSFTFDTLVERACVKILHLTNSPYRLNLASRTSERHCLVDRLLITHLVDRYSMNSN